MSQSSAVTALQLEPVSPEKTQEREEYLLSGSHHITPLPRVSPEDTQDVNTGEPGPESWSAHQRDGFSGPRLLQLPIHRKALHSLIGQIWFLWLTVIFSCPDYLPFVANPPHVLACLVTSSEKFLRNTVSLAAVLILPHMKLSSQFNVLQFFPTLYILKTITKPVFKNGSIPK